MEDLKKAAADLNQKTESLKSGQEPVSGETGEGTVSEPFDQGNAEGKSGKSAQDSLVQTVNDTKAKISETMTGQ